MKTITLTGIDQNTTAEDIDGLLEYPAVELGVLWSANPERRPRYPSFDYIEDAVRSFPNRIAIHVCGNGARAQMKDALQREDGIIYRAICNASRIQINGKISADELAHLLVRTTTIDARIITQHNSKNGSLCAEFPRHQRHELLVDASGGRGILPVEWRAPVTKKRVGFAGGITPSNLSDALSEIEALGIKDFWVDMETGLRKTAFQDRTSPALGVDRFDFGLASSAAFTFARRYHRPVGACKRTGG